MAEQAPPTNYKTGLFSRCQLIHAMVNVLSLTRG
jgi:hypothetical protein